MIRKKVHRLIMIHTIVMENELEQKASNETYDCAGAVTVVMVYMDFARIDVFGFLTFDVDCFGNCSMESKEVECGQCLAESDRCKLITVWLLWQYSMTLIHFVMDCSM
eukprot:1068946_1